MTIIQSNAGIVFMAIVKYIGFVWGVSWRTFVLSLTFAILSGIALGVLSAVNSWPPSMLESIAPYLGMPTTLIVFCWVMIRRTVCFIR